MKYLSELITFTVLFVVIGLFCFFLGVVIYLGSDSPKREAVCTQKGGVWLNRELVCIKADAVIAL